VKPGLRRGPDAVTQIANEVFQYLRSSRIAAPPCWSRPPSRCGAVCRASSGGTPFSMQRLELPFEMIPQLLVELSLDLRAVKQRSQA
jgi:hypothetical protein